jgi:5-methylcytosine-specific restriction endonuclease McrA
MRPAYGPGSKAPDRRKGRHLEESRAYRSTAEYRRWRQAVIARDGSCVDCGTTENLSADHVVPVSRGGERYALENGACRCVSCNSRKGNR